MGNDTKRRLAYAAAFLILATAGSRVLGLIREVVQTAYLGMGPQMSAFVAAQKLPNLVRSLLADTALSAAFIPIFSALLEKDKKREAWQAAFTVTAIVTVVLSVVTLLGMLFAPEVVRFVLPGWNGSDPQTQHVISLTASLTRIMFPQVILLGLCGLAMGILNSYDHFSTPAMSPIVWNLVIIAATAGFAIVVPYSDANGALTDTGFKVVAWATLAGTVAQLAIQLPALWKRRWRGYGERLKLNFRDPALWDMVKIMWPVMISLGIISFNALIGTQFASLLADKGAVAQIDKAFRLFQLPQGVFAIAIGTVLFPALSRHAASKRFKEFREDLSLGIRQIFFLTLPFAAFFAVLSVPTIRLVFQHGRVTDAEILGAGTALAFFSVGMAFVSVNTLLNRAFYSIRKARLPLIMAVFNLALNALLDWALYKPLGVGGITLATSLVSILNFFGLILLLSPRIGGVDARRVVWSASRTVVALIPLAAVSYGVWWGLDRALGRSLWAQIVSVLLAYILGAVAYALAAWAMRIPEMWDVVRTIRRRREPHSTEEVIEMEGGG